jgi:exopolyphosphatase/guanosine-5'-triphosphate,3'-diphosphate pyrophosphatase
MAVVDIGSNSGRVLVVRLNDLGHLDVVETEGTPLRLVHELSTSASLGEPVVLRTLEALRGFETIARGAGATNIVAVATAAVREASNGVAFVQRLRSETGLDISVISGELEARYGFLGAVYGVPANDGVLVDIGGGSVQITRFRDRILNVVEPPLPALRLSDRPWSAIRRPPPTQTTRRLRTPLHADVQAALW